ncbi:ParA family protein [Caminibacter pacificus]|uniref:Cellulose biosynthesis protein BcsQ n=1 Tax=Caminibacter pacificus TaxID=1424653 RepID=A0AAJ4RE01_9BACT|nr:ParA family protein [Caminibacter pacificus]NPA87198.1 ParA family protein [Campylobacterota bacterium]QCI28383.1 ParA family protein [Caminibacter pacificus]ROR40893.1 cellulose biosynthesis protein BcsQ [Caminibacter pacificus]
MIISLYNIKGGVGKTSTCINLASTASKTKKVLIIDLDIQGASSYFFGKKPKKRGIFKKPIEKIIKKTNNPNIDIIPSDKQLIKYQGELKKLLNLKYDIIFIDAPATLNDLTKDILKYSDIVLSPVLPNILSLRTYNQLLETKLNKNIKLFVNAYENKPSHKQIVKAILKLPKSQYLKTYIPKSEKIENMPLYKMSVVDKYPYSLETKRYQKLLSELI